MLTLVGAVIARSGFAGKRVKHGFDVIAIVVLPKLTICDVLALQRPVKVLFHDNTAVESISHPYRHLLKRYFRGFILAAQTGDARQKKE
jgi:hypothetical protein